jgi:hypothetical protein
MKVAGPVASLLLALGTVGSNASNTSVYWWLGSYNEGYAAENMAFVGTERDAITGVFHCCTGPTVFPNGTMPAKQPEELFVNLTRPEISAGLTPVLIPLSPHPTAVQQRLAVKAVPRLLDMVVQGGFGGYVVDYEPHDNTTADHAQAFVSFLTVLAEGLHSHDKLLVVCVSDWGILAPKYYKLISTSGADKYVSMGSTYKNELGIKQHVTAMKNNFPLESVVVGIGTMAPANCSGLTGDYKWTSKSLSAFVDWVAKQGVTQLGMWRADICTPSGHGPGCGGYCGVEPWILPILRGFLADSHGDLA